MGIKIVTDSTSYIPQEYIKKYDIKIVSLNVVMNGDSRREVDIDVKYNGFNIPDEFVVGYGLDYDQMYRNLPFIGVVHLDDENWLLPNYEYM